MTPEHTDQEPDEGTVQSATLASARLWVALALTAPGALTVATAGLLDDERAATELRTAADWLLASASQSPQAQLTPRLLRLLSLATTLDEVN